MTPELLALLRGVDGPTLCNALAAIDPALKARGYTTGAVVAAQPDAPAAVGYARTARIVSYEPAADPGALRERRFAYYEHVAAGPRPALAVMQDIGRRPGFGCIWGGVNVALHKALGAAGALTNGAIRDLGALDPGFVLLGGSVCPGAGHAHIVDFGTPVEVFGLPVRPGDLLHADRHGAVLIPPAALPHLPDAIDLVLRRERVLFDAAAAPGFDPARLRAAWAAFEAVR